MNPHPAGSLTIFKNLQPEVLWLWKLWKTQNWRFFDSEVFLKGKSKLEVINNINQTTQEIWFQASLSWSIMEHQLQC